MQPVDVLRRQRSETETQLGRRRDHVGLDATLDATDVQAQSGQPAEAQRLVGLNAIEQGIREMYGLMQGRIEHRVRTTGMAGMPAEVHQHRADAAMCEHGFAIRRLGDQHRIEGDTYFTALMIGDQGFFATLDDEAHRLVVKEYGYAFLAEARCDQLRDLRVFTDHQARQHFDLGHPGAEAGEGFGGEGGWGEGPHVWLLVRLRLLVAGDGPSEECRRLRRAVI